MNQEPRYRFRISVAPMMDWTDRHCRYMLRLISRRAFLYTEMVTVEAILRGDRQRLLGFDDSEHPLALQLGGSMAAALRSSASDSKPWVRRAVIIARLCAAAADGHHVVRCGGFQN